MSTEYLLKDRDRYATATLLPIKQKFPVALNLPSTHPPYANEYWNLNKIDYG